MGVNDGGVTVFCWENIIYFMFSKLRVTKMFPKELKIREKDEERKIITRWQFRPDCPDVKYGGMLLFIFKYYTVMSCSSLTLLYRESCLNFFHFYITHTQLNLKLGLAISNQKHIRRVVNAALCNWKNYSTLTSALFMTDCCHWVSMKMWG